MSFNELSYWPWLFLVFVIFLIIQISGERAFFKFVKQHWFYKRSLFSYLSSSLFLIGLGGLILSLLDIRGPEEKVKTFVAKEKTLILIDTSASMLAEDVKPSRLKKATLIAKHFTKKAVGHQIAVVVFSEIQKKIVPFTSDLDLINARLDSIENLNNRYASSALTLSLQESVQYFREGDGEQSGNILVLTDGEETAQDIELKVSEKINIAFVGIGTKRGGRIPLDDATGVRFGYKKDGGKTVITKLDENFFKKITSMLPSSRYWTASSYSLPSEEILDFFQTQKEKSTLGQDIVIKPVLMEWVVIPSLVLMILSFIAKWIKIYAFCFLLFLFPAFGQNEEEVNLPPEILTRLEDLRRGGLSRAEKIKLADDLYRAGAKSESLALFGESLPDKINQEIPPEAYLNFGTGLLEKGRVKDALETYQNLLKSLDESPTREKFKEIMNKNILTHFKKVEQQKKKEQQKQQKGQDKPKESGGNPQKGQSNDQQKSKDQRGDQQGDQNQQKGQDEEKKSADPGQQPADQNKSKSSDGKEKKEGMPPAKIPAKLKQLMSDDRKLQMKMIEQGTRDLNKRKSRKSKDW